MPVNQLSSWLVTHQPKTYKYVYYCTSEPLTVLIKCGELVCKSEKHELISAHFSANFSFTVKCDVKNMSIYAD